MTERLAGSALLDWGTATIGAADALRQAALPYGEEGELARQAGDPRREVAARTRLAAALAEYDRQRQGGA